MQTGPQLQGSDMNHIVKDEWSHVLADTHKYTHMPLGLDRGNACQGQKKNTLAHWVEISH